MKRALFFCLFSCLISTLALSQGFQPAVTYPSGADDAHSMAVADVNGDGKPDLLVANYGGGNGNDGSVAVLLGNGDGTFQPPVSYDAGGWQTFSVVAADLKGDGKLDLVVTNSQSNTLGVLLGNGDGTFQPAVTYHTLYFPMNAVVADVNGDGIPDLVVDSGPGYLSVLLGKGNGTFKKARQLKGGG
ncbi:MAG: VCBS repeat-containing protein, partial [Terriglobales bacterium]